MSGSRSEASDAPYQQKWFPGVHSAVGGGGERRGLSDQSLDWVLDGARAAGLVLDPQDSSRIFELKPDYIANSVKQSLYYRLANWLAATDRMPGPRTLAEVSMTAQRRWLEDPQKLEDKVRYRPRTLDRVKEYLDKLDPMQFGLGEDVKSNAEFLMYQVQRGDTLSAIAKTLLGSSEQWHRIYEANLNKLDSPDRIYPGKCYVSRRFDELLHCVHASVNFVTGSLKQFFLRFFRKICAVTSVGIPNKSLTHH